MHLKELPDVADPLTRVILAVKCSVCTPLKHISSTVSLPKTVLAVLPVESKTHVA